MTRCKIDLAIQPFLNRTCMRGISDTAKEKFIVPALNFSGRKSCHQLGKMLQEISPGDLYSRV